MKKICKLSFAFLLLLSLQTSAQAIQKWKLQDLKAAIQHSDKPTIINFWATFCKPCIEEIPYFQSLAKKYEKQGVQLILVNLDSRSLYPAKLNAFMKKRKITGRVTFLDETDADLFCPAVDPSWSGAIPASLFINNKTGYRQFFEDQLNPSELEEQIKKMLQ